MSTVSRERSNSDVDTEYEGSQDPRLAFTTWRVAAWAGPVFLVALGACWAGVAGFLPPPAESMTATEVQRWFIDNGSRLRIGLVGYLFFAALYIPWCIAISRVIQRIEGPKGVLSQVEFAGGVCTAIVALLAGVMWLAASFRTETRSPEDIQLLMDLGWFIFNLTFMVTALQMLAVGIAVLVDRRRDPLLPKWITWISFAFAATFIPLLLIPFSKTGPFAWDGLFNYYVALGGAFVWDAIVAFYLFAAINKIQREELG